MENAGLPRTCATLSTFLGSWLTPQERRVDTCGARSAAGVCRTIYYQSLAPDGDPVPVIATAHNITNLEVPTYGDPRREVRLECHYVSDVGEPPLHSVKWYRDNNEIFRYTPDQVPAIRTFNTSGGPVHGNCTAHNCTIFVTLPKKYNTKITFMCEVSAEGPRFAVVKVVKHLTVAVALKKDPVITGAPATVAMGEDVIVNCTTDYAFPPANLMWYIDGRPEKLLLLTKDPVITGAPATVAMGEDVIVNCTTDYAFPPANLMWYIDGRPEKQVAVLTRIHKMALKKDPVITGAPATVAMGEDVIVNCTTDYAFPPANLMWYIDGRPEKIEPWMSDNTETSDPDRDGLRTSWRALQIKVATPRPFVDLRCEATQPVKPVYTRSSSVKMYVARSPHLSSSMFTASGTTVLEATCLSLVCTVLHIFSKYSALGEV
ncbi:hypothetical protein NE865_00483 [Phthorimaea operculella]|nr:hypothetical protein NE865_00483 [Phthorimaea operculella]